MKNLIIDGMRIEGSVVTPVECVFGNLDGYNAFIGNMSSLSDLDSHCLFDDDVIEKFWLKRNEYSLPYFNL